jgi:hypothetical protein
MKGRNATVGTITTSAIQGDGTNVTPFVAASNTAFAGLVRNMASMAATSRSIAAMESTAKRGNTRSAQSRVMAVTSALMASGGPLSTRVDRLPVALVGAERGADLPLRARVPGDRPLERVVGHHGAVQRRVGTQQPPLEHICVQPLEFHEELIDAARVRSLESDGDELRVHPEVIALNAIDELGGGQLANLPYPGLAGVKRRPCRSTRERCELRDQLEGEATDDAHVWERGRGWGHIVSTPPRHRPSIGPPASARRWFRLRRSQRIARRERLLEADAESGEWGPVLVAGELVDREDLAGRIVDRHDREAGVADDEADPRCRVTLVVSGGRSNEYSRNARSEITASMTHSGQRSHPLTIPAALVPPCPSVAEQRFARRESWPSFLGGPT